MCVERSLCLEQELVWSSDTAVVDLDVIVGRAYILGVKDYLRADPTGTAEADVFFCQCRYTASSKTLNGLKNLPKEILQTAKLVERGVPRVLNRLGAMEVHSTGIAKVGTVPIAFVPDSEIPRHIKNVSKSASKPQSKSKGAANRGDGSAIRTGFLAVEAEKAEAAQNASVGNAAPDEITEATRAAIAQTAAGLQDDPDEEEEVVGQELFQFNKPNKRRRTDPGPGATRGDLPRGADGNDDLCKVCEFGGNLVCCDSCPRAFHPRCIGLTVKDFDNDDEWNCPECNHRKPKGKGKDKGKGKGKAVAAAAPEPTRGRTTRASLAAINEDANDAGAASSDDNSGSDSNEGSEDEEEEDNADGDGDEDEDEEDDDEDAALARQRDTTDDFFHNSKRSSKTSDRTLAQLGSERMDQYSLSKVLAKRKNPHAKEQAALLARLEDREEEWATQLVHGFNMLCYGFGSKKAVLMGFSSRQMNGMPQIVVNGYFPSLHIKQILTCITDSLLGFAGPFQGIPAQVAFIVEQYGKGEGAAARGLLLIVNNIDGPMLRNETAQTALSQLAESANIHVAASIDQLNAPLMWDHEKLARFNWVWHDCTTFQSYGVETSYEASLMASSGTITVRGTMVVMQSLTRNGRKVYWILLEHQSKFGTNAEYKGLRFSDYLGITKSQFAAHDDSRLRAYMTEFEDHKLMMCRKTEGVEFLSVPVNRSMLASIIEMMHEHFAEDKPK
jgi:origin recognition complex subunit 2